MRSQMRHFYLVLSLCLFIIIVYLYLLSNSNSWRKFTGTYDYSKKRFVVNTNIIEDHKKYRLYTKGCKINDLPLYDAETKDLFKTILKMSLIPCKPNLVQFERYNETSVHLLDYNSAVRPLCYYRSLNITNGDSYQYGPFTGPFVENLLNLPDIDFVHILCYNYNLSISERKVTKDFDRKDPDLIHNEIIPLIPFVNKTSDSNVPNVLLLAIDSTSYLNFKRQFLNTEKFLNKQKFFELRGYNKVGANTFPNMIPFFTGHNSDELFSGRKLKNISFDDWPIIWKEYSAKGFVTAFLEEMTRYGLFRYCDGCEKVIRLESKPTDYQTRPFHHEIIKEIYNWYCYLDKSETERGLDWTLDFVRAMNKRNQKYFAYISISELTHSWIRGGHYLDVPYYQLFSKLFDENLLENTVIFYFSDHGFRSGKLRQTHTGEIENRLPFMFIYLPEYFNPRHKENLRQNQFRLTTPFDIHSTLIHLIRGVPDYSLPHGQSLIDAVISDERDCNSSSIPEIYCSCYEETEISNFSAINPSKNVPKIVDRINSFTAKYRSVCSKYQFYSIHKLFKRSVTRDYSVFKLRDSLSYIIQIFVNPGMALFETVLKSKDINSTAVEISGDIIRINLYGNQSHCINDKILKNYCFCNDLFKSNKIFKF